MATSEDSAGRVRRAEPDFREKRGRDDPLSIFPGIGALRAGLLRPARAPRCARRWSI